jgi:RNA polymerase sigma-70 factor, ECF subfamily
MTGIQVRGALGYHPGACELLHAVHPEALNRRRRVLWSVRHQRAEGRGVGRATPRGVASASVEHVMIAKVWLDLAPRAGTRDFEGAASPDTAAIRAPLAAREDDAQERALIVRLKAYDDDAIRHVYRLYSDGVYRFALYQLGDRAAAEDVAGETFLRMLNTIERYEYRGLPLRVYLYRIARNLIVDHQRFKGRFTALEDAPPQRTLSANPAELAEQHLAWQDLRQALDTLTEDQRQVVLLKFVEGLDNKEVAQAVGKNEGSVKSLQHRALGALRRTLERRGDHA